jgi:transmembrane sensor
MMNDNFYRGLCIKSITGDIRETDKKKLDDWLLSSDENMKEYGKLLDIWRNSSHGEEPPMPDIDEEWLALANRMEKEEENKMISIEHKKYKTLEGFLSGLKLKPVFSAVAAVIILVCIFFFLTRQNQQTAKNVSLISDKELRTIQLPDGSTILLNSSSRVEYSDPFNEKMREIRLSGEGYFSVVHQNHPFVIITENARIIVVGTKFNVKSENEKTSVVVREGHVRLSRKTDELKEVDLLSGQKSIVEKDHEPSQPVNVNADYLLDWINGKFVYERTPLGEIVDELQKYYKVKISFTDDSFKSLTLSGAFYRNNLENILSALCLANGLNYKKVKDGYLIRQDPGS